MRNWIKRLHTSIDLEICCEEIINICTKIRENVDFYSPGQF